MSQNTYSETGKFDVATSKRIADCCIPTRFVEAHLHTSFSTKTGMAMDKCREYARDFPTHQKSMILAGSTGSGKTHMACATVNEIIRLWADYRPVDVRFFGISTSLPEILDARFFRREDRYLQSLLSYLHADILIVDDLLHVPDVEWAKEVLYRIYESRYQNQLPTITTLNAPKLEDTTDPFEAVRDTFNEPFMRRLVEDARDFTLRL